MNYETHEFDQGSPEWHAHRDTCNNASDLAAAAGESPYKSRDQLIRERATGEKEEINAHKQRMFDDGHRFEELARPFAEEFVGDELYPSVVSAKTDELSNRLGVSYDGKTMADDIVWEHKTLNDKLATSLDSGVIPDFYHYQMEQGMLVCGASKCLFTASKWDGDNSLIDIKHVWYESNPELRAKIIPIWKQVEADAAAYQHVEVIPAAVAAPTEGFGALVLQVEGRVVACNIDAFRAGASAFLARLPKPEELNSDQDFANAESAVKACSEAESKIKAAKDAGLAQMSEVDTVFRVADQIVAEIKAARLSLEKSVELRKTSIRGEIVQSGKDRFADHIYALNKRLGRVMMPLVPADFVGAIKGKRTVVSLQNAVDTVLANSKITANEIADKIQANLATLDENKEHAFLLNDLASLAMKAPDDLQNIIKLRISEHQAEQQRKLEAEREKIRREEQAKAEREQQEKAAAEKRAAEQAERIRLEEEAATKREAERIANESAKQNTPPPVALSPESENAPALVRQAATVSAQTDTAWKIAGIVADMTDAEKNLVLHYCERIINQRKEAA